MEIIENLAPQPKLERMIKRGLLPRLEIPDVALSKKFINSLTQSIELMTVCKGQFIEEAGSDDDGKLLYLNSGIAHTFYYDNHNEKPVIPKIWKKHDIIFDLDNFLNYQIRQESVQMLEDGELLSISYQNLRQLMNTYPNMVSFLLHLQAERERQYKYYQHLFKLSVGERVKLYLSDNPAMINRINHEFIAVHLGVSRSRFSKACSTYKRNRYLS